MPPFDGNIFEMPPAMNPAIGDLSSAAWQLPFSDRPPGIEPSQLSFGDIFQQLGATTASDQSPAQLENLLKDASNIDFTSPAQNQRSGKKPDFFLNPQGKLIKNPDAEPLQPGQPLNIEVQANGAEGTPELQNAVQSIINSFLKFHQGVPSFPRTWEEVMQMLAGAADEDSPDTSGDDGSGSMMQTGGDGGGGAWGGGGTDGGGMEQCYSGAPGGDRARRGGASHRNVSNAPAVPWDGKSKGDMNLATLSQQAASQGRRLWEETQWAGACQGGDVGCAASVSKILQEGGYRCGSAGVVDLAGQLASGGWAESSGAESAQPGDVIYGNGGGDNQHIGIVGVDEKGNKVIYNNHSDTGVWSCDPFNACSIITGFSSDQVHVLHAPTTAPRA